MSDDLIRDARIGDLSPKNLASKCQLPERARTVVDSGQYLLRKLLAGREPEPKEN